MNWASFFGNPLDPRSPAAFTAEEKGFCAASKRASVTY
jgi:hypothetical protein